MKKAIFLSLISLFVLQASLAQEKVFPIIEGYGAIEVIPFEVEKVDTSISYKILTEMYYSSDKKDEVYGLLDYSARMVNAFAYAGIPSEKVDMAMVIFSGAMFTVLSHEEYQKRFGMDNPNLEVIQKLTEAGVKIYVCGQSMMKQNLTPELIQPGLTIASSRIVATAELLHKGYLLMN
ncbi:MAG: DsrE family protein [Cyclobacteriaceae bacterium]|nr:DsrE family protein [Cyclobacteriaceae bacterium]